MEPRLATGLFIQALRRSAEVSGGVCTVIARGDPVSGAVLLLCVERGVGKAMYELGYDPAGQLQWRDAHRPKPDPDLGTYLAKRRQSDPDLWVIELDIPASERFAADFIART